MAETNGKQHVHNMDKNFLDLFWALAEENDSTRVVAAEKLCKIIEENKSKDPDTALFQQNYSVKRLVRGLASSRKCARTGFAVALTKLLRQVKDIKIKYVLNSITEELKISANDSKSETGNKLIGLVFTYGALVQSGRKLKDKHLNFLVTDLLSVGEKRSYIRPPCTKTLVDLIGRMKPQKVSQIMWPVLRNCLDKGWEGCTPDTLLLLLACCQKDETLVDQDYLKAHWGAPKVMAKDNFRHILNVLMRSVESQQSVPLVVEALVKQIDVDNSEDLASFWNNVGSPLLASTIPRKQIAVSLFCQLLDQTCDVPLVLKMLFPGVAAVICKTADKKDDLLTDICATATSLLVKTCSQATERESVSVCRGFLQTCHRLKSFALLQTPAFVSMVGSLKGKALEEFVQTCMDTIVGRGDLLPVEEESYKEEDRGKDEDKERREAGVRRSKLCEHIVPLLRVVAVSPNMQHSGLPCRVLQFLFLHTFFKVTQPTKDIPHCQEATPDLVPSVRAVCQATFYRTLTQLLSMRPDRRSQEDQVLMYMTVLTDLAIYTQKLLKSSATVHPVKEISKEVRSEWDTIIKIITAKTHKERKSVGNVMGESKALELLILHLAFDLFTQPQSTSELLKDIYLCRLKAAKKQNTKHVEDGEPQWMEVTTEILLSILSRASKLARKTMVTVFKSLFPHLTPAAVLLIIQVIEAEKPKSEEEEIFEFEDMQVDTSGKNDDSDEEDDEDDDDDDDEGDDDDDEDDKSNEDDLSADDDSDDGDEDDDDDDSEGVDEQQWLAFEAALNKAGGGDDDEDRDLTDAEMFKLDETIVEGFRALRRPTKKEKKEKRREVTSFRLRAFDLLEAIVRGDRCGDFVLELLEPLLKMMQLKHRGGKHNQQSDFQQLYSRATEIFNVLCKQRNLTDRLHGQEEMLKTTNSLLDLARSTSNPHFAGDVARGCLCIMRLSHQSDCEVSPVKTRTVQSGSRKAAAMSSYEKTQEAFVRTVQAGLEKDIVKHKNMAFFSTLAGQYANVFWPLSSTLLGVLQNPDSKVHTKMQACSLLVVLLRNNKREALTDEQWNSFSTSISPLLKQLVLCQQKDSLKAGLLLEAVSVMYLTAQRLAVEEMKELLTNDVMSHLSELKGAFNKDLRKQCNRLTELLNSATKKSKKNKKRKLQESEENPENGTGCVDKSITKAKKTKHQQAADHKHDNGMDLD